ncbi:MAG: prolyl aminopeptidase [Gammaproteobacteria bacterium]|nr:prolyl aminopeptidase [Gammaproteobacteria bacterium]
MLQLYPEIKPYARHKLKVDDTHELYIDESGEPQGIPVLFVHAGPGSGCEFDSRSFFNPEKYRIILFDQRGAGRSTPHGEVEENTTEHLVEDIERIRAHLDIDKWVLFGGGWGSTLSLVYAETHPDRMLGLILRGIFLGRERDIDWFYRDGVSRFFPDLWEDFLAPLPVDDREDSVAAYARRLAGADELRRMGAAKAWSRWEADCSTLHPNQRLIKHMLDPHRALARCRIGVHYFNNRCFLEENQIIDNIASIRSIPGIIVHGRYDMICPLENAFSLHEAWRSSQIFVVREAGHSATEPSLIDALIRATRDMSLKLEDDFNV